MIERTHCDFCTAELDLGREFIYQFESLDFIDDEALLERVRNDQIYYRGEPLRLCKDYSESVERNRAARLAEQQEDARIARRAARCDLFYRRPRPNGDRSRVDIFPQIAFAMRFLVRHPHN